MKLLFEENSKETTLRLNILNLLDYYIKFCDNKFEGSIKDIQDKILLELERYRKEIK